MDPINSGNAARSAELYKAQDGTDSAQQAAWDIGRDRSLSATVVRDLMTTKNSYASATGGQGTVGDYKSTLTSALEANGVGKDDAEKMMNDFVEQFLGKADDATNMRDVKESSRAITDQDFKTVGNMTFDLAKAALSSLSDGSEGVINAEASTDQIFKTVGNMASDVAKVALGSLTAGPEKGVDAPGTIDKSQAQQMSWAVGDSKGKATPELMTMYGEMMKNYYTNLPQNADGSRQRKTTDDFNQDVVSALQKNGVSEADAKNAVINISDAYNDVATQQTIDAYRERRGK